MEDASDNRNSIENGKRQFPPVPEDAIVKSEEERPVKMQVRPDENLEEKEASLESADAGSEDTDGDGSPDWYPALGPGV